MPTNRPLRFAVRIAAVLAVVSFCRGLLLYGNQANSVKMAIFGVVFVGWFAAIRLAKMNAATSEYRTGIPRVLPYFLIGVFVWMSFTSWEGRGDHQQAVLQPVLAQLDQNLASNLVREASLCIANSLTQKPSSAFYSPPRRDTPTAYSIRSGTRLGDTMGNSVWVDLTYRIEDHNGPYMTVKVPVHCGGANWWHVIVRIKPGGRFVQDGTFGYFGEGFSNDNSFVKLSDEILVSANRRTD